MNHRDAFEDIEATKSMSSQKERLILLETNRQLNKHVIRLQKQQWLSLLLSLVFGILVGYSLSIYAVYSSYITAALVVAVLLGLSLKSRPEYS